MKKTLGGRASPPSYYIPLLGEEQGTRQTALSAVQGLIPSGVAEISKHYAPPFMKLSPEAIKDFQEAYKKDFGEDISAEEAKELGSRLIRFMSVIYRPIPTKKEKDSTKIL